MIAESETRMPFLVCYVMPTPHVSLGSHPRTTMRCVSMWRSTGGTSSATCCCGDSFDEEVKEAEEKPCNGKEEAKKAHEQCTERYEESGEGNF